MENELVHAHVWQGAFRDGCAACDYLQTQERATALECALARVTAERDRMRAALNEIVRAAPFEYYSIVHSEYAVRVARNAIADA